MKLRFLIEQLQEAEKEIGGDVDVAFGFGKVMFGGPTFKIETRWIRMGDFELPVLFVGNDCTLEEEND